MEGVKGIESFHGADPPTLCNRLAAFVRSANSKLAGRAARLLIQSYFGLDLAI
jgi:hypothetical protein